MVTILDPNSTPMVKSCTRWNLLSVNCNKRHDFPTPEVSFVHERERERESQTSVFYDFEEPALIISNGKEEQNVFVAHTNLYRR